MFRKLDGAHMDGRLRIILSKNSANAVGARGRRGKRLGSLAVVVDGSLGGQPSKHYVCSKDGELVTMRLIRQSHGRRFVRDAPLLDGWCGCVC
jgi:hypothetical protein